MVLMLSPQQLGQLVPLAPSLIAWLRHSEPSKAADLFLAASTIDMDSVQATLRELLNAQNYNGDLTNVQLRYICSCHNTTVWASAVRLILAESEPRLVPPEVGSNLCAALTLVKDEKDAEKIAQSLGAFLDQIPRTQYNALAEFCALLRDTTEDPTQLAYLVGPMLLSPRTGVVPQTTTNASAQIMNLLIREAEIIFGRPGAFCKFDAFGVRKPHPVVKKASSPAKPTASPEASKREADPSSAGPSSASSGGANNGTSQLSMDAARSAKRMQQLRAFYLWRDPSRAEKVGMLFANHRFEDIARAIYEKYGMLPPGTCCPSCCFFPVHLLHSSLPKSITYTHVIYQTQAGEPISSTFNNGEATNWGGSTIRPCRPRVATERPPVASRSPPPWQMRGHRASACRQRSRPRKISPNQTK